MDNFGPLLTVSVIFGNIVSVLLYFSAFPTGKTHRMTGNHIYDFFMGSCLNPRIFNLDLKMWAEIRISWILLFLITVACAVK